MVAPSISFTIKLVFFMKSLSIHVHVCIYDVMSNMACSNGVLIADSLIHLQKN